MKGGPGNLTAVVIEDEPDVSRLLATVLGQAGWQVVEAGNGADGLAAVNLHDPDLVTLDLSLPDIDGLEVCRRIRAVTEAYVIMLTARVAEVDRLLGLQTGADDYLTKPFSPRELVARVNVLMRRPRRTAGLVPGQTGVVAAEGLAVDLDRHVVHVRDTVVDLTKIEFSLLSELVRGSGRVWTRQELLQAVWGSGWAGGDHTVDVHMANLRRKLGQPSDGETWIETVRGVGYRLAVETV